MVVGGVWLQADGVPGVAVINLTTGGSIEVNIDTVSSMFKLTPAVFSEDKELLRLQLLAVWKDFQNLCPAYWSSVALYVSLFNSHLSPGLSCYTHSAQNCWIQRELSWHLSVVEETVSLLGLTLMPTRLL